jgi:transposase
MLITGCDFHTRYQPIAMAREETAELMVDAHTHRLLQLLQIPVEPSGFAAFVIQSPFEATVPIHWFVGLLAETRSRTVDWRFREDSRQRSAQAETDQCDDLLILDLLLAKRFPRIWVPTPAECDLRQLPWHRHKLVSVRTMKNESWSDVGDRRDGWWNQFPPQDSSREPWSKCREEKSFL